MPVLPSDVEGRLIQIIGITGGSGTSVNLNTVQNNVLVPANAFPQCDFYVPLMIALVRFSTGNGPVPAATVTFGDQAFSTNWNGGAALSGAGPFKVFFPGSSNAPRYAIGDPFVMGVTSGAAGTCDVVVYGVTF